MAGGMAVGGLGRAGNKSLVSSLLVVLLVEEEVGSPLKAAPCSKIDVEGSRKEKGREGKIP